MIYSDKRAIRIMRMDMLKSFSEYEMRFLCQLDFLLDRSGNLRDGHVWVYLSGRDWARELHISRTKLEKCIHQLEARGILLVAVYNRYAFDKTRWFSIDYEELEKAGFHAEFLPTSPQAAKAMQEKVAEDMGWAIEA